MHYFNPFAGIDKEKEELLDTCIRNIRAEANVQYCAVKSQLEVCQKKIDLYRRLIPDQYALVEMPLDEIMSCVAKIEDHAYTVWKAFLKAYPKNHFSTLILEYAENDGNDEEGSGLM